MFCLKNENNICFYSQVMVQRTLAAKNMVHAKAGCIIAGYLKFLPVKFTCNLI